MPRYEELAFIKTNSKFELNPVFLLELRKAMAAEKKALEASKPNATSKSALKRPSGVGGEARIARDSPQLHVNKRKAEEVSSSDFPYKASQPPPCAWGICSVTGPRSRATRTN